MVTARTIPPFIITGTPRIVTNKIKLINKFKLEFKIKRHTNLDGMCI